MLRLIPILFFTFFALIVFAPIVAFSNELPAPADTFVLTTPRMNPIVHGDSVRAHHLLGLSEADPNAAYAHPYEPVMDKNIDVLPQPQLMPNKPKRLSLRDAIDIALRNNPDVKIAELQRILDKFNLELTLQQYRVQWQPLQFTANVQNKFQPTWSVINGISVPAPTGTTFSVTHTNNLLGGAGVTQLQMQQHLLQGFGLAYNQVNYDNGIDNEAIAKLTFKNNVITDVVSVITAYRQLVSQYNSLDTSKQSLKSQLQTAANTQLEVKVGQRAPSDLLQLETNIETTRLSVVQQEDAVRNAYFSFLTTLGLVPSTQVVIDRKIVLDNKPIPSLKKCIALALAHNPAYQQALLQLKVTKRGLITAENARKWTLDLTSAVTLGSQRTQVGEPITSQNTNPTLGLALSVPIDNIQLKSNVVSAKVAIEDAELSLKQTKETLVSQVMNEVEAIKNQYQQIQISNKQVAMQEQALFDSKLQLKYGQTTVFEVNTYENTLLSQKVALISENIDYLSDVTTLYQTLGLTLDRWGIKLRY